MRKFVLKLYVAGQTARTRQAVRNIQDICEGSFPDLYELVVIDVLDRPQLAENERILATPTLVKELPPPLRRVVGDLSDRERVLIGLDLAVHHNGSSPASGSDESEAQ